MDSWCGPVFKTILLDKLLVYFDCHHFYLLVFCLCKKKRAVILSLVIWWKLKFGSLKNIGGIMWGCRITDYLQFPSWIYYYFIPHIFQLRKFFSTWLKSLKWIQLLCDYINSPRVVLFCHKVGFGFTLPTMKSIESGVYCFTEILSVSFVKENRYNI